MGALSKIEWTDHTFNPWWGCTRVSEACRNCYAETFDKRVHGIGNEHWGPEAPRRFFGDKRWAEPLKWNARAERTGVRERVFCASMADVFEDRDDLIEHRRRLWLLISATPHLDWLLLTKRPENFRRMLPWFEAMGQFDEPWPHVWLGVTAETQADAARRIPLLLATPAVCRFVSVEPMLEAINLTDLVRPMAVGVHGHNALHCDVDPEDDEWNGAVLDWVICGGESGPGARPMHPDWARSLRDQCVEAGTAFLFKQWGAWAPAGDSDITMLLGKKAAGRELDGRTWDQVPEVRRVA
ncbi:MAG: phage Gp37/Gp68 family protein [Deltaproteobacteria bacterium]|jgi:protein gp37